MENRFGSGCGCGKEFATRLVQSGVRFDTATGAISVPIYQAATFAHPAPGQSTGYDYTRTGNPTIISNALLKIHTFPVYPWLISFHAGDASFVLRYQLIKISIYR